MDSLLKTTNILRKTFIYALKYLRPIDSIGKLNLSNLLVYLHNFYPSKVCMYFLKIFLC